jgi:hypothetical protein
VRVTAEDKQVISIELHGYGDKPIAVLNKICVAFEGFPDADSITLTVNQASVMSLDRKPRQFFRVYFRSDSEYTAEMMRRLESLGERIQFVCRY